MSLFGDDDVPARTRSSGLFDDEPKTGRKQNSSLFADDFNDTGDSPWTFPTPKKAARGSLVKTLLPATDVPESYVDAFDSLVSSGSGAGNGVSVDGVKEVLRGSGIDSAEQAKILETVLPAGQDSAAGLGRGEFNVLFALIGLAQEGEDITLDGVDERRKSELDGPSHYTIPSEDMELGAFVRRLRASLNCKYQISDIDLRPPSAFHINIEACRESSAGRSPSRSC
jgi:sorting nexin-8